MPYWLMKSEPDELSIHDLQRLEQARWDGVRNYQARNFVRSMQPGDLFFFYHSSCPLPGIAGIGRIASAHYPDPTGQPLLRCEGQRRQESLERGRCGICRSVQAGYTAGAAESAECTAGVATGAEG